MASPTAVGFVIEGMSGPGSGVWARFQALVVGLHRAGYTVHALAAARQADSLAGLPITVEAAGRDSRAGRFAGRSARVGAFVVAHGLGLVYVESPPFVRAPGAPAIASIHDLRGLDGRTVSGLSAEVAYQRTLLGRHARRMDAVAVLSPWAAGQVCDRLGVPAERVHVIPPIIEPPDVRMPAVAGAVPGRPYALVLGHLERRKNVGTVIRAALSSGWPDGLDLVVAGRDAGEGPALRTLAAGGSDRIRFVGAVPDDVRATLLAEAAVVLVPSLVEGFGIVAVEAPLAGAPALVADRTALPDLAGTTDAVVPVLDVGAWAGRVSDVVGSPSLRLSILDAQRTSAERFRENRVMERVLAMHAAVLGA